MSHPQSQQEALLASLHNFFTSEGTSLSQNVPSMEGCTALCLEQHQAWHSTLGASRVLRSDLAWLDLVAVKRKRTD